MRRYWAGCAIGLAVLLAEVFSFGLIPAAMLGLSLTLLCGLYATGS